MFQSMPDKPDGSEEEVCLSAHIVVSHRRMLYTQGNGKNARLADSDDDDLKATTSPNDFDEEDS